MTTINEHVEVVRQWLEDTDSVGPRMLRANAAGAKVRFTDSDRNAYAYYAANDAAKGNYAWALMWVENYDRMVKNEH